MPFKKGHTPWSKNKKLTEEIRNKMRQNHWSKKGLSPWNKGKTHLAGEKHPFYGKHLSEDHRLKLSLAKRGEKAYWYGKRFSEEHVRRIGLAGKGRKPSESTKKKISLSLKDRFKDKTKHPKYGKKLSEEVREKISNSERGKIVSEVTKERIRELRKKIRIPMHHTKPELKFIEMIEKYNLPYKYVGDGKFWIENINPDFVDCNGEKVAIEIFGRIWHDESKTFKNKIPYHQTEKGRKEILAKYGWKCLIIWDDELKQLSEEKILKRLIG